MDTRRDENETTTIAGQQSARQGRRGGRWIALGAAALLALLPLVEPARAATAVTLRYHFTPGERFAIHYYEYTEYQLQMAGKAPYLEVYQSDYIESAHVISVTASGVAGVVIHLTGTFTDTLNGKTTVQVSTPAQIAKTAQHVLMGADNSLPTPNTFWPSGYGATGIGAFGLFPSAPVAPGGQWQGTASQTLASTFYPYTSFPAVPPMNVVGTNTLMSIIHQAGRPVAVIDAVAPLDYSGSGQYKSGPTEHVRVRGLTTLQSYDDLGLGRVVAGRQYGSLNVAVTNGAGKTLLSGLLLDIMTLEPTTVAPF